MCVAGAPQEARLDARVENARHRLQEQPDFFKGN